MSIDDPETPKPVSDEAPADADVTLDESETAVSPAPVEDLAAEETPTEEAAVEEPVIEEAPVEEAPRLAAEQLLGIVEALVFASPEPLSLKMLTKLLADEPKEDVAAAVDAL